MRRRQGDTDWWSTKLISMDDLTGKQLGPYRIVTALGAGGMATVYEAYQPCMDRYVALKVLPRQLALVPEFVGRFQSEARLIASLLHPHIVPVHDFGQAEGYMYLVMSLVEGCTLAHLLCGRPLPLTQVVQHTTQVADALDYAHSRGIVHRDIKPSNVLIDERGNCLLTDFGLAQVVQDTTRYTKTGIIVGTPAYMSPEQGRGEKVDQRSDIYSLGVVLFQMTTGQLPFDAATPVGIVTKHIREPLPSARALNPALPESVQRVIAKAMAKSPADRFASAGAMSLALQAAATTGWPAATTASPNAPARGRPQTGVAPAPGLPLAQNLAQPLLLPVANQHAALFLPSIGLRPSLVMLGLLFVGLVILSVLCALAAWTMTHLAPAAVTSPTTPLALSMTRPALPLPEKAIWLEERTVRNSQGSVVSLQMPHVNRERCIGCGICEYKCPVNGEAAIRVYVPGDSAPVGTG